MNPPSASSRHLSAFSEDIHFHLEQTGLFSKIRIKKTGSPTSALLVRCQVREGATQQDVAETLKRVWHEAPLSYECGHDAYEIKQEAEKVWMQFATATESVRVTGRIEVIGF